MIRLIISPAADADLKAIWRYLGVEKGNIEAANHILDSIRDTLLLLPRFPHLGRCCTEFDEYVANLKCITVEGTSSTTG
jgi:plasmid stabilization system protein ParE